MPNTHARASSKPRILVPLAHEIAVPRLVRAAAKIASLTNGELVLLHVVPTPMMTPADPNAAARESQPLFDLAHANLPAGARVRTEVRLASHVGAEIRRAASELKADLMVVGWRESFSLKDLVQGTLEPVLQRPPCDVLIADLDEENTLERIVELPGHAQDELGVRILAAAAEANATGILLHDREPRTRAELTLMTTRHARVRDFAARGTPHVRVSLLAEARRRPLHLVATRAVRAFLILIAPGDLRAPTVHPRPLARLERPLVVLAG